MASLGIPLVRLYSVFDNSGETGGIKWAISFREEGRGRLITGDCLEGYHELQHYKMPLRHHLGENIHLQGVFRCDEQLKKGRCHSVCVSVPFFSFSVLEVSSSP